MIGLDLHKIMEPINAMNIQLVQKLEEIVERLDTVIDELQKINSEGVKRRIPPQF